MKKILKFLFNRWTLTVLGLASLCALIWFAGPLIAIANYHPLESDTTRYVCIALIISFYIGKLSWEFIKARNLNTRLMDGLLRSESSQPSSSNSPDTAAVALLQKRFEEAITLLKKTNLKSHQPRSLLATISKQYMYELPWYIFIGAPGSGKTTALINSGLQFPLADRIGSEEIRGVGGTRNCDWFFTNEAVLLDTAGRFVTQESHQETDSAEWLGFLQLLKKYRPRRPINGIMVTISVADLLQLTPTQRESQANEIRKRVQELHTELNIRFPIYVLVTKVDLLVGFMEFFGKYGKDERSQVWGTTFPLSEKQDAFLVSNFRTGFIALEQRINDRLIDYLQQERDLQKRASLYTFPQQFSSLKEILGDFLNQIFSPSRFEQQPLLRGIYFTSGTQEGNPIDRIMGNLARELQLDRKLLFPNKPSGKSFFLTKLINEVILSEAELAGTNLRWERRQASLKWATFTIAILAAVSMITAWTISYSRNQTYVAAVEAEVSAVSKQIEQLSAIKNPDWVTLLAALKSVQELTQTPGIDLHSPPLSMGFGLYQGDKLAAASNNAYQRLLQDALLPQLILRIEYLLSNTANIHNLELLYEGLKAYIMLNQPEHFDAQALKDFIVIDWEANLPREFTNEQRKALESHLDTLLNQSRLSSPITINTKLIDTVRTTIAKIPIAERIYNRLKRQGVGADIPEFTIAKSVGSIAPLVFSLASGAPLTKGVPGLFSYDGYYKSFSLTANEVTKKLVEEEVWVLAIPENQKNLPSDIDGQVRRLYLQDYAKTWEAFINDIKLKPTSTARENIELTRLLSAADSPLPILLRAIVREVTLTQVDKTEKNIVERTTDSMKSARSTLTQLLGQTDKTTIKTDTTDKLENIVDNRFKELRYLVQSANPGQSPPIDAILTHINQLYMQLIAKEEAQERGIPEPASNIYSDLTGIAPTLPEPLRAMITKISKNSSDFERKIIRENINKSLKTTVTEFCHKATSGRYPFTKGSKQDVTQNDFAKLFSSGGLLDTFFKTELAQHVDTSNSSWQFRKIGGTSISSATNNLREFQRAHVIRDVFFRGGAQTASINFTFTPMGMDSSISQFILDVDGQSVKYSHGPQIPISIQWPGPRGSSQVRVQIVSNNQESKSGQVFGGPWALFRMFDQIQINPSTQPERFTAIFDIEGQKAQFAVETNSVQNPFRLRELEQFKCPTNL